jgi:hypothetical protein
VVDNIGHQIWDPVSGLWARIQSVVDNIGHQIWDIPGGLWRRVWDRVGDVEHWLGDHALGPLHWVWSAIDNVGRQIWDIPGGLWQRIWDRVGDVEGWFKDLHTWMDNNVLNPIMGGMGDIGDAFREAFDRIGKTVQDALDDLRDKLLEGLDALRDAIVAGIKWPWEHIFEPFVDVVERKLAIPGRLVRGEYSSFPQLIDDLLDPAPIVLAGAAGLFLLVMVISFAVQLILQTFVTPMALPYQQATQARVGAQLLTVGVIQQALNRGFIDEATAADHLARAGYSGSAKQAILDLRNLLPGPGDLIHMAVHEVFNPQLRETLNLDSEFPDPFLPWALKLGYSEEWARNFWADHWDLPSPSQGYEMLHRGEIDMPRLESLLKALDYAPVWRQPLINIAYNPITRVDLRRLYKSGIITEEDVFLGYKAQGYDEQKARWLTDYTKQYYSPEDASQLDDMADLAVSTFRTAYRRHVITRDEAIDKIVEAGYTEDVADFLLSIDDAQLALNPTTDAGVPVRDLTGPVFLKAYRERIWDRSRTQTELEAMGYLPWEADLLLQLEDLANQRELTDLEETVVREQYLAHAIDRAEAGRQLDDIQVRPERRDLLLQRWDLQGAQKTKRLTLAQLQAGFRDGLLTDTQLLDGIMALGYNDSDAKFLVDSTDKEPASMERRLSAGQLQRARKIGIITDAQLSEQLLALRYSQADAELLVKMAVPTPVEKARQLSVSLLQVALRSGLLTDAAFLAKVTTLGYSPEDAELLVKVAAPAPVEKARQLSASQLQVGFRSGLVTEAELLEKLTALGYAQADAELLRDIAALKPEPPPRRLAVANLKALFKAGTIDKAGLLAELLSLGYTERDAGWIADLIAPEE